MSYYKKLDDLKIEEIEIPKRGLKYLKEQAERLFQIVFIDHYILFVYYILLYISLWLTLGYNSGAAGSQCIDLLVRLLNHTESNVEKQTNPIVCGAP